MPYILQQYLIRRLFTNKHRTPTAWANNFTQLHHSDLTEGGRRLCGKKWLTAAGKFVFPAVEKAEEAIIAVSGIPLLYDPSTLQRRGKNKDGEMCGAWCKVTGRGGCLFTRCLIAMVPTDTRLSLHNSQMWCLILRKRGNLFGKSSVIMKCYCSK